MPAKSLDGLLIATMLIGLLFAVDGVVLLFLNDARMQSEALAGGTLPRVVAAQRLAVDASHLAALTAELPASASVAERQTVIQRIDGMKTSFAANIAILRKAGLGADEDSALMRAEAALVEGAEAMNGIAQSGIDLRNELARQRDRARQGCETRANSRECQDMLWALAGSGDSGGAMRADEPELKAVAVLQRDLAINEQRRINLLRRQSELAARFLSLAGAQSEAAGDELARQQRLVVLWIGRMEWVLGAALAGTLLVLLRLKFSRKRSPAEAGER